MPARITPRLSNRSIRPGESIQRPAPPGGVAGLTSKRKPLERPAPMAPTQLYYDIPAGAVGPGTLQPLSVTNDHLEVGSVTADKIVAGSISADLIAAGSITADKLNVSQLSAITADMGTLTAGTIQGGTIQTGPGNPRVKIDATGITMTAADGTTTFAAYSATGVLTLGNPSGSQITFDPALAANQKLYLQGTLVGTGSIMGPSFITGLTNPRLVMDAQGLRAYPASSYPTTQVLDDFNRPNTGPPPSDSWDCYGLSGNFQDLRWAGSPGLAIRSNRLQALTLLGSASNDASLRWSPTFAGADLECYATVWNTSVSVELWCRHDQTVNPITSYVLFYSGATGQAKLQKFLGGPGWTDLTSYTSIPGLVNGVKFGIRTIGSAITGWYCLPGGAWTQFMAVTDASYANGSQIGLLVYSTAQVLDDFGGGAYVAGSAGVGGSATFNLDSSTGSVSMSGGTLTAATMQTAAVNPKVVFSASGIVAYAADGSTPWRVDSSTGTVTTRSLTMQGTITSDLKGVVGARKVISVNANQAASGAEKAYLQTDDTGVWTMWGASSILLGSSAVLNVAPQGMLQLASSAAILRYLGGGAADQRVINDANGFQVFLNSGNSVGMRIMPTGAGPHYITVPSAAPFLIGSGVGAGTANVRFLDGDQVMSTGVVWQSKLAFTTAFGNKAWLAATGQTVGAYTQYQLPAGTTAAINRTPGAITLAAPFLQANNSAQLCNTIGSPGCQFTFNNAAIGQAYCYAIGTAS